MSTTRKQWLLKVISGPHQGAEIGVYAGKTLIGSDDECDVVLHDVLVAPQHVELEISASSIVASPLGGRVFLQGKRIREASQRVQDYTFLSIGGSHLVIGPADGVWPLLSAADAPELEKEVEPKPEATQEESEAPAETAPTTAPVEANTRPVHPGTGSRLGPFVGIAAGVLLLIGWAYVYFDFKAEDKKPVEVETSKPVERARAIIQDMGLVDSIKIEDANGRLAANGYVDTESKQRELQATFRVEVPGLRTKIYSLEKIASSARSLIDNQRLPLQVSSLSEGKLKISGTLPSADPWIQMRQTLMSEVPGISAIEDSVVIEAPAPEPATKLAGSDPPMSSLVSRIADAVLPPKPAAYEAPKPDPKTDYVITPDTIDTPDATVATVRANVADGLAYVRLSTGGVYFVGARLPYGGTVERIESDTVTVIEKGVSRTLRQGDAAMNASSATTSSTSP